MPCLTCFSRFNFSSNREDIRSHKQPWLRVVLMLLSCFLLAGPASGQTDQCALNISVSPASPITFGQPATVTVTRNFPAMLTVTAPVSLDGQQFCTYTNPFINPSANTCPAAGTVFNNLASGDHTVSWTCTVLNDPNAGPPVGGSQTFTVGPPPPVEGSVDPKFLVLSVIYAPPGSKSSVDYNTSSMMGASTAIDKSFGQGTNITASLQFGPRPIAKDPDQTTITAQGSALFTQTKTDSSSVAVNKTTTSDVIVKGPASSSQGINHDYDIILLWINPRLDLTFSGNDAVWKGYTFDPRDPANEVDVVPVYVAWLKNPSTMPSGVAAALARTWASPSTDGSGPGLTQSDFNLILTKDPFANGVTTIDPTRFDLTGQTFAYAPPPAGGQPITEKFSLAYQETSSLGKTVSDETKYTFSVEGSVSFVGIVTAKFKDAHILDITNSVTQTTSQASGQKGTLSLTGPTADYTGPTNLQVFQDNIYGTFMFAFVSETQPSFSLSASPVTQIVVPGGNATYAVTVSAFNGFNGSIDLSAAGAPTGCSAVTFNPPSLSGGSGSSIMTVPACSTPGLFAIAITGTSGSLTDTTSVVLDVTSASYLLEAGPAAQSIASGQTTTYTVSSTQSPSFSGTINLNVSGLPQDASGTFNPSSITGAGASILTVTTASTTPPGITPLLITGTSGNSPAATTTVGLVVSGPANQTGVGCNVTITLNPPVPVEGQPMTYTATASTVALNSVSAFVNLDSNNLCNINGLQPSSCSVTQNSLPSGTHALRWGCTSTGPGGGGGGGTGSGAQTFAVAAAGVSEPGLLKPKFVVLSVLYAPPGQTSTVDYSSSTALGTSSSIDDSFSKNTTTTITLGGGFSLFKVFTAGVTFTKSKEFTQTSDSTSSIAMNKTDTFDIKVPGPAVSADGIDHNFDIILVWLNPVLQMTITGNNTSEWAGFAFDGKDPANEVDVVPLYVAWLKDPSTMPADVKAALARTWADPLFDGSSPGLTNDDFKTILKRDPFTDPNYVLTLNTGAKTTADKRFDLQVGETLPYEPPPKNGQPLTETFGLSFQATQTEGVKATDEFTVGFSADFSAKAKIIIPPIPWLTINLNAGFKESKTLDWKNIASQGGSQAFTQAATLSLTGPSSAYTGPTDVQVFKDNVYHTFMFAFNPFSSTADFDLWPTPDLQTVPPGGNTTYSISALGLSGFSGSVALTASGAPAGISTSFSPSSITGTTSSTLTVTVASSVAPGTYPLTITGTSSGLTHTTTINVVVDPATFELTGTPPQQTILAGGGTTYTVSSIGIAGFTGTVGLTVSGLPAGISASFVPATISGTTSATLTVTAGSSVAPGSYPFTVTGASGSITQTETFALVVSTTPFFITASPSPQLIMSGGTAKYIVSTISLGGFNGAVQLSVGGLPPGATATISPTSVPGVSNLVVNTSFGVTPASVYTLTITGTSGGQQGNLQASTSVSLLVSQPLSANGCSVDFDLNPPIPADGQPVTVTATLRELDSRNTGSAGISLDNQMFCGASDTSPCVATTNPLSAGVHTLRYQCTTNGPGGPGAGSAIQFFAVGTPGSLSPKYQVLSVIYAPPGQNSNVDYGTSTVLGTSISYSDSFSQKTSQSVSLTGGVDFGIPNLDSKQQSLGIGLKAVLKASDSFAQTVQEDLSVAVSKTQSSDILVPGPKASTGINHDYDVVLVWINPISNFVVTGPDSVLWLGYSFDPSDPVNEVDVIPVYVAWLKDRSLMPPGVRLALARTWADDPSDGSGRGLTDADFTNILARDPFANGATSIDPNRFVLTGETFSYAAPPNGGQPLTEQLSLAYQTTTQQSHTVGDTFQVGYTLTSAPAALPGVKQFFNNHLQLGPLTVSSTKDKTITLTNSLKRQNTQTENQTASLSLAGPAVGYTGPTDLQVYQDNVYGTFMFSFVPATTFVVSATAPSQTTTPGGSVSYPVSTTSFSGFTGPIVFSTSGLPAGATGAFSPPSLSADGSSTLTISTSPTLPVGTYKFTIEGTVTTAKGSETHGASATLFVVPANGFLLTVSPSNQTIHSGDTTTYLVSTVAAPGFNGTVNLSASRFAMGDTATFNPASITGIGTSTMTVFASPDAPIGNFNITITGTSSGLPSATTTVGLLVTEQTTSTGTGCSVAVAIEPAAPIPGELATFVATLQGLASGNTGSITVNLDHQPLCTGTTSCSAVQNTPPAGIHVVEWSCTSTGSAGSGSGSGTQTFPVGVVQPSGSINPKYVVLSVIYTPPGQKSTVDYGSSTKLGTSTTITNSFKGGGTATVTLGPPQGIKDNNDINTEVRAVTFTQSKDDTTSISVNKTDTFDIQVPGLDNPTDGINHDYDVILLWINPVLNFDIRDNSNGQLPGYSFDTNDPANEVDVVPVYVKWLKDAIKDPASLPPGIGKALARLWAQPATDGSGAGLTVNDFQQILNRDPFANGSTTIDPKRFDLQGGETFAYEPPPNGGQPITQKFSLQYQTISSLGQTATDDYKVGFSLEGSANIDDFMNRNLNVAGTLSWTNKVKKETSETVSQTAALSLVGPCFGYVGPTDVQVYRDNIYGTFMFTFVNGPTAPDFSLCATKSSLTINTGANDKYTISTSPINGFGADVGLTVSGVPAGVTASFSPNPIPVGAGSSSLLINVSPSAAAGTYPLVITGTGGSITHTMNVTLVVKAVAAFSVSVSPSSQNLNVGSNTTYTVTTSAFNGFNGSVALSQTGLPNGATGSFSPASISGSTSSTLTVNTTTALAAGTYPITITGTSGSLTQTTTATLVATTVPTACLSPASLTFASQNVGSTSAAKTITLTSCGTAALSITSIAASGEFVQTNNCGTSLAAAASCTIQITFTPTAFGARSGTLNITDNASGSPQTAGLSGTGAGSTASLSPGSLTFAGQNVGAASAAQAVTLTNNGNAALSITSISGSGDFAQTNNCGSSVAPGASCAIQVTFTPTAPGSRTGTLSITDNAPGSPQSVGLGGTGIGPTASLSPASLTFAAQNVGTTSAAQPVTLTNSGTAALSITSITVNGDFGQTNNCGNSLASGASCAIQITFTPTATGARAGTLTVNDNAPGSPHTASLNGTGAGGAPVMTSLSVTAGPVSTAVTTTGSGFGTTQGSSTVTFNGTAAQVTAWGASSISTKVPLGATSGNVVVKVAGQPSNGIAFSVQEDALHIFAVNCATCGAQVTDFTFQGSPLYGYAIRAGDVLYFYQQQSTGSVAGITLCFSNGEGSCDDDGLTVDQDGKKINADTITGVTHFRRVDLSHSVGLTLSQISLHSASGTHSGRWDVLYSDIQIISADGTVRTIYTTGATPSLFGFSSSGVTQRGSTIDRAHPW